MSFPLRISSPKEEGVLHVSKWNKCQVLLGIEEMEFLLHDLEPLFFFIASEPVEREKGQFDKKAFLGVYTSYIDALRNGCIPEEKELRRTFSSIMSATPDVLYALSLDKGRYLVKPIKPVIQLQAHHFFYSSLDGKFHPMVLSTESVTWGIQLSYPQMYQDPKTARMINVVDSKECPNTFLFTQLLKWLRKNTVPTPFLVEGKKKNVPMRIGKSCFAWIDRHPQLRMRRIEVDLRGMSVR